MAEEKSPAPGTSASPFNRTVQHDAKRLAILSQAARLFNYKGSRATTLKDIAENLGLTKTSLYYYVKTKEELIYQCYLAALAHHQRKLDDIDRQYAAPRERLGAFFLQHFDNWLAAREGRGPHIAALLEIASLRGAHRQEVEAQYIALFKRIRQYLRDGIAEGSFRRIETTATTRALLGSVDWTFSWLHRVEPDQVGRVASCAVDILMHGLYGGPGEYHPSAMNLQEERERPLEGFNREQQKRAKQEAFYKTGTWFFNKQGFNGTSLDEIAEHLHVSKGAFYYHIRNKEDLLFKLMRDHMNGLAEALEAALPAHGDPRARLEAFIANHVRFHVERRHATHVSNMELRSLSRDHLSEILRLRSAYEKELRAILRDGQDAGVFAVDDVALTSMAIIQMITGVIVWFRPDDRLSIEDVTTKYQTMTMRLAGALAAEEKRHVPPLHEIRAR